MFVLFFPLYSIDVVVYIDCDYVQMFIQPCSLGINSVWCLYLILLIYFGGFDLLIFHLGLFNLREILAFDFSFLVSLLGLDVRVTLT